MSFAKPVRQRDGRPSRFTAEIVDEIERQKNDGAPLKKLAATFGTTTQHIQRLLNGQNGPRLYKRPPPKPQSARPCATSAYDIKSLKARGYTLTQIAAITGKPYREVEAELR